LYEYTCFIFNALILLFKISDKIKPEDETNWEGGDGGMLVGSGLSHERR
jgi:hypothetical protein